MAYLREITPPYCTRCLAKKRCTVELVNARNAVNGRYCTACGDRALKQLQALEDAERKEAKHA